MALERTRALLGLAERLAAVTARAVGDVQARELFVLDEAGSTRSWLRTLPCGEGQHASRARQLGRYPVVESALREGVLSAATASLVCSHLERIPADVPDEQLFGLLVHGVPDVLSAWTGGLIADDLVTDELIARREEAAVVLRACADDTASAPAARLEPVFVLLARTVTPAHLASTLGALVDALLPEQLDGQDGYDETYVRLRKVLSGGWDLLIHLDDVAGQTLAELLETKVRALLRGMVGQPAPATDPEGRAADAGADRQVDPHVAEQLGLDVDLDDAQDDDAQDDDAPDDDAPDDDAQDDDAQDNDAQDNDDGDPEVPVTHDGAPQGGTVLALHPAAPADEADVVEFGAVRSRKQNLYDAFVALLLDATAGLGQGVPRPAQLTIVTSLGGLQGQPGATPGVLTTARGAVPLPTETVRRLGCDGVLAAVLLDALGNPVGASGTHRHASRRERRALRAQWGPTCAVLGCASTRTVPHHVEPWWLSRRTRLRDLLPVCEHHHHDVHEGGRTLRLRDGRLINFTGWGHQHAAAA
ncbi:MAG TPA: hypothetical protein VFR07_07510 [Mycobacteriales bacterium]|nr:hypothetical protein [Mycobacteriales bacterium]